MAKETRYGIFKVIATCTQCGNPVEVNGPLARPVCSSCSQQVEIPPETWQSILADYLNDYDEFENGSGTEGTLMSGNLTLKYSCVRLPPPDPACPKCETNWDLQSVQNGATGILACKKCGHTTPVFPAPSWLTGVVPEARQVFFAERETDGPAGGTQVEADQAATHPIALACPQCAGSLLITGESERTVPCKYCGVDVYLPDGVWLKLHPAKVAKYWLVRFEGPFKKAEED